VTASRTTGAGMVYDRRGNGPTVVFLHGWCLNGRLWNYQEAALLDRFEVVVPDLPGFGRSDAADGPYTLERQAEALLGLLEEADLREVSVVGFAYGGAVGMHAARADATRIARLAVVGVPQAGHTPDDRMLRSMRRDWPDYARRSARAICTQPQSEATIAWLESMFVGTRLAVALEAWQNISGFDPETVAAAVSTPTLYIHGADDTFTPVTASEASAQATANGRVAVAEQCGHMVVLEQPEWFQRTLEDFLAERV
jgi:pimeloyl-ACP methyl ester carboxylesterase